MSSPLPTPDKAEQAWTPGPWPLTRSGDGKRYVVGDGLVEADPGKANGYEIAEVYSDDCDGDLAEANARLISAAPELYEALEAEFADLEQDIRWAMDSDLDALIKRRERAEAALAKARGEVA